MTGRPHLYDTIDKSFQNFRFTVSLGRLLRRRAYPDAMEQYILNFSGPKESIQKCMAHFHTTGDHSLGCGICWPWTVWSTTRGWWTQQILWSSWRKLREIQTVQKQNLTLVYSENLAVTGTNRTHVTVSIPKKVARELIYRWRCFHAQLFDYPPSELRVDDACLVLLI